MTPPLTQAEIDGTRTSLEAEFDFWAQVISETTATHSIAGYSDEDRAMHRVEIGSPTGITIGVIVQVHGNEPAARESALSWFRDIAYSTDPETLNFLQTHRIVMVSPGSPDAFRRNIYAPTYGDINRDYLALATKSAQVIVNVLSGIDPHLVIDVHEFGLGRTEANTFEYFHTGMKAVHEPLRAASQDALAAVIAAVAGKGHSTGEYSNVGRISGREMGAWHHCPSILHETWAKAPMPTRMDAHRTALEAARLWVVEHGEHLVQIKAESRASVHVPAEYPLQFGAISRGGNWDTQLLPATLEGYQITGDIPTHQFDIWGITHQDGYVPLAQDKRVIVPLLLDPASDDAVTAAIQVHGDPPDEPALPLNPVPASWRPTSMHISVGGHLRPVVGVYHQVDGKLLPAKLR